MSKQVTDVAALREAAAEYAPRVPLLQELATNLEDEIRSTLEDVAGSSPVRFRVKAPDSFARKSLAMRDGARRYNISLADVEDQVAGRVWIPFAGDINTVVRHLLEGFSLVRREYDGAFVFAIPPHVLPAQWSTIEYPPTTFEVQVLRASEEPEETDSETEESRQPRFGAEERPSDVVPRA